MRNPVKHSRYGVIAFILLGLCTVLPGCGHQYVKGTKIDYSEEKQELADLVERYRRAVEQRDVETLRAMTSLNYYENGSTTTNPNDDYDYNGLEKVFSELKNTVRTVKYNIKITDIRILGDTARVDFEYRSQYLFGAGEQDRWETAADKNRLQFRKEQDGWRILSGM
ncbi:MAG: nuclear transport factor 2 family protein [Myxococcota bacterium]|nr:nuclear transport factor 2 family protein [Myxococcota bacterium]